DAEGFPIIPGRYGQIEWFDGQALAVYSDHPRLFRKLWAIANVRRHQTGDHEMRAVFPPEALAQVAAVIRAIRWGGTGLGRPENFSSKPGHLASSRPREPIPDAGRLPGAGGAASTGKRVVEVNPTATPGAGSTSGREGEPDGRRHQLGRPRPTDRLWNPRRTWKGLAGRAPNASGSASLVDSASPSKLITPRLLSLRAA